MSDAEFRVVRVLRVAVSEPETFGAADTIRDRLTAENPDHEYTLAHVSYPLDEVDELKSWTCPPPG